MRERPKGEANGNGLLNNWRAYILIFQWIVVRNVVCDCPWKEIHEWNYRYYSLESDLSLLQHTSPSDKNKTNPSLRFKCMVLLLRNAHTLLHHLHQGHPFSSHLCRVRFCNAFNRNSSTWDYCFAVASPGSISSIRALGVIQRDALSAFVRRKTTLYASKKGSERSIKWMKSLVISSPVLRRFHRLWLCDKSNLKMTFKWHDNNTAHWARFNG